MKKKFLLILIFVLFAVPWSLAEIRPFTELWNNLGYYDTHLEKKGFSAVLGRYEGKLGFYLFAAPIQVYGVYYGVSSSDKNHWNNVIYYGGGIRFWPFGDYLGSAWYNEWIRDLKVFAETLSSTYLKDTVSGEVNKRSDVRYGIDLWHEWNLDDANEKLPWGELWGNFSYRSTNFGPNDFNDYLFYLQPKIGWHLGKGAEAYLRGDLTISPQSDYWLNTADYGLGLRFEPWRQTDLHPLLKKFKIFIEALSVSYLKDKPADPNKIVNLDVRFGVDFSYGRSLEIP